VYIYDCKEISLDFVFPGFRRAFGDTGLLEVQFHFEKPSTFNISVGNFILTPDNFTLTIYPNLGNISDPYLIFGIETGELIVTYIQEGS
jgi:hypothetical protein